jgi:hypothetical protein
LKEGGKSEIFPSIGGTGGFLPLELPRGSNRNTLDEVFYVRSKIYFRLMKDLEVGGFSEDVDLVLHPAYLILYGILADLPESSPAPVLNLKLQSNICCKPLESPKIN